MIPVGTIRYDIQEGNAIVSINMAPDQRRKHLGSQAVILSEEMVFQNPTIEIIHAFIRANNIASLKTFAKSGYINAGTVTVNNGQAYDYIKKRP